MPTPRNTARPTLLILFAALLALTLPGISLAQGRGNGNGRGSNLDKKCAKFVNCHDARDGRWDGRGPAVQNTYPYPNTYPSNYPYQNNYPYPSTYPTNYPYPGNYPYPTNRNRRIDRDGDGDIDRDDRINRRHRRVDRGGDGDIDRDDGWWRQQGSRDRNENRHRHVRRHRRVNNTN